MSVRPTAGEIATVIRNLFTDQMKDDEEEQISDLDKRMLITVGGLLSALFGGTTQDYLDLYTDPQRWVLYRDPTFHIDDPLIYDLLQDQNMVEGYGGSALNDGWSVRSKRLISRGAGDVHRWKGSARGIELAVKRITGLDIWIEEVYATYIVPEDEVDPTLHWVLGESCLGVDTILSCYLPSTYMPNLIRVHIPDVLTLIEADQWVTAEKLEIIRYIVERMKPARVNYEIKHPSDLCWILGESELGFGACHLWREEEETMRKLAEFKVPKATLLAWFNAEYWPEHLDPLAVTPLCIGNDLNNVMTEIKDVTVFGVLKLANGVQTYLHHTGFFVDPVDNNGRICFRDGTLITMWNRNTDPPDFTGRFESLFDGDLWVEVYQLHD